ncbi:lipopolysaccharide biosynthesis protein [Desulfosoma sp.]|uniref:lipopolysaccharide biosynthesis protein n=1 Tax=Desulfosoma sp. TaxID=2603217 RepID=UPI00404B9E8D
MSWRPGAYARDGLRIFGWLVLRAAAQAITVLLLARWLGASQYGAFVAAVAVASFFTPLASMGMAAVILGDGARTPQEIDVLLRKAVRLWLRASLAVTPIAVVAIYASLPPAAPLAALAALALAEVAAVSLVELLARVAQAKQRAGYYGAILAGLPWSRLAVLLVLAAWVEPSLDAWVLAYAVASLLYAAVIAAVILPRACPTDLTQPQYMRNPATVGRCGYKSLSAANLAREGTPFVAGALASRLQAEFNKPVLAQLGYAQVGAFGVAQRVIDLATLPLAALQEALWPRVFATPHPYARLWRTGAILLLLALTAGGGLVMAAPLLPWLLGPEYAPAAEILALLAFLPAVQWLRNLGNAYLMLRGQSQKLSLVYATSAAAGVLLALLLVPPHGVDGAVWAMYGGEGMAIITQGILSWIPGRKA